MITRCIYDKDSQLLTGSMMDYCVPLADNLPDFAVDTQNSLCTHDPLGVKGCGEVGATGSPPAVINAVIHALKPHGVRHLDMPATPEKVLRAIWVENQRMAAE